MATELGRDMGSVEYCWITKDTAILTRKYACTSKSFLGPNAISCFYNLSPNGQSTMGKKNSWRRKSKEGRKN
jgi:hypothetical protein